MRQYHNRLVAALLGILPVALVGCSSPAPAGNPYVTTVPYNPAQELQALKDWRRAGIPDPETRAAVRDRIAVLEARLDTTRPQ